MKRRHFISVLTLGGLGLATYRFWPDGGVMNPCPDSHLPDHIANHALVKTAWQGIDANKLWDCHVHLVGLGDSNSGIWIDPDMLSLRHPKKWVQRYFYLNASCAEKARTSIDQGYVNRLIHLHKVFPKGSKLMLLAFDYFYDEKGEKRPEQSFFYTPNQYAQRIAAQYSDHFEWIASIHPYRKDAVDALSIAVEGGARAVKWLPAAQGMDPASPKCDAFYYALVKNKIPLLVHAGAEKAVEGGDTVDFGNPLRLRRPLEQGVRVLVAHSASLGQGLDLDKNTSNSYVDNIDLFARMMDDTDYVGLLFGEISAMTQINRFEHGLSMLIERTDWHLRLVNGSDYPLPGVMPLFSVKQLVRSGYLAAQDAITLSQIHRYNPLLFDLVLKRNLQWRGKQFGASVFESRKVF